MMGQKKNTAYTKRHDAETFRVAEELMMLSSSSSLSHRSGIKTGASATKNAKHAHRPYKSIAKKHRSSVDMPPQSSKADSTQITSSTPHRSHPKQAFEISFNSRVEEDVSVLLLEHRTRCRHVRRKWSIFQRKREFDYARQCVVRGISVRRRLENFRRAATPAPL